MQKSYFITAIGTDSGKTVVSAILTHALQADYWKPVQCGTDRDFEKIELLVANTHCLIFEEAYRFKNPVSPHAAAQMEGVTISMDKINLPENEGNLFIIEGAGGILVPLNDKDFIIDLAAKFGSEVILVCNHYLGSINHALLSINEIKRRNLPFKGIIFNGEENRFSEEIILKHAGVECLLRINKEQEINHETIVTYGIKLFENWKE